MIFSDLLSALQVLEKIKIDYPMLNKYNIFCIKLIQTRRKLILCGFLDMSVCRKINLMIELLKMLLTRNLQMNQCPLQTRKRNKKTLTAKYIYTSSLQKEWDEAVIVSSKLCEILQNCQLVSWCFKPSQPHGNSHLHSSACNVSLH